MVERKEGRENRESAITLAQVGTNNNEVSGEETKTQEWRIRSSTDNSTSRRIERRSPGPIISPEWTGTVVTRPSSCPRKTWLPRVRMTWKPILWRIRTTSLPFSRGRRVIRKFAGCPPVREDQRHG